MSDFEFDFLSDGSGFKPPALQDKFELNEEQVLAVNAIRGFLRDHRASGGIFSPFFGLFGYAGTGKTTVIQRVFDEYEFQHLRVAMSAPTHKAVGVLHSMAHERGMSWIDFSTIHRLCNVKKFYRSGKIEYRPALSTAPALIARYDVVVVDECSMVSKEMWGWINEAIANHQVAVIMMGDPAQLPPVGEKESPTFSIPHAKLSKVMRSRGVVLNAATELRLSIGGGPGSLKLAANADDEHGEVVNLNREAWLEALLAAMKSDVASTVKALAFTNKVVDQTNDWLREQIFGKTDEPFIPGERLVTTSAYETGLGTLLHTESELLVVSAERATHLGLDCWNVEAKDSWGAIRELMTLDKDQKPAWTDARRKAKAKGIETRAWREFYQLEEGFAKVRPGWATTIHKSQGSTYTQVFLNQENVLGRSEYDPAFTGMLLYVGYSRASIGLYLM